MMADEQQQQRYIIEEVRERRIPKFDVHGFEYQLKVNLNDQFRSYDILVQELHAIITGISFFNASSRTCLFL